MKKSDPKELAGMINLAMQENPTFKGTKNALMTFFKEQGVNINENLWSYGLNNCFTSEQKGKRTIYSFKRDAMNKLIPIYYKEIESAIAASRKAIQKSQVKATPSIDECVAILKKAGYKIYQPITKFQEI